MGELNVTFQAITPEDVRGWVESADKLIQVGELASRFVPVKGLPEGLAFAKAKLAAVKAAVADPRFPDAMALILDTARGLWK